MYERRRAITSTTREEAKGPRSRSMADTHINFPLKNGAEVYKRLEKRPKLFEMSETLLLILSPPKKFFFYFLD